MRDVEENWLTSNFSNLPLHPKFDDNGLLNIGDKKYEVIGHDPGVEYMLGPKGEKLPVPEGIKGRISPSNLRGLDPNIRQKNLPGKMKLLKSGKENSPVNFSDPAQRHQTVRAHKSPRVPLQTTRTILPLVKAEIAEARPRNHQRMLMPFNARDPSPVVSAGSDGRAEIGNYYTPFRSQLEEQSYL